jgi:putative inorganic carbon (hco3(-)) transporter
MSLFGIARRLASFELWVVALAVTASVASQRLLVPALAIAALFWPIRWLAFRRLSVRTSGDWAAGGLLLLIPVTLWATALPEITRAQVLQLLMGLALYYAAVNWTGERSRLGWLRAGLVAAGLGLALIAPFSTDLLSGKFGFLQRGSAQLPRLLSETVNPNVMAGILIVLIPLALAVLLFSWRQSRPIELALMAVAAIASLAVLPLTESRGALISLAAALLVLIALRWRWGWLALPLSALGSGVIVWRVGVERISALFSAGSAIGGLSGRPEVWSRALYMIQDFPFTGVGMGTFKSVANLLYPFFTLGPDADVPHAHNLALQVAVDLGLPGLIAWLTLFGLVVVGAWQVYRRGRASGDGWLTGLGAGLLASQMASAVHGLTDAVTWGTRPAVLVWAVWGLAMAAWNLRERADSDQSMQFVTRNEGENTGTLTGAENAERH